MKSCPILLAAARIETAIFKLSFLMNGSIKEQKQRDYEDAMQSVSSKCVGEECEWYVKSKRYTSGGYCNVENVSGIENLDLPVEVRVINEYE